MEAAKGLEVVGSHGGGGRVSGEKQEATEMLNRRRGKVQGMAAKT